MMLSSQAFIIQWQKRKIISCLSVTRQSGCPGDTTEQTQCETCPQTAYLLTGDRPTSKPTSIVGISRFKKNTIKQVYKGKESNGGRKRVIYRGTSGEKSLIERDVCAETPVM